ncbi:unnamed protein product, partial [Sphenostylis stenocarpa]
MGVVDNIVGGSIIRFTAHRLGAHIRKTDAPKTMEPCQQDDVSLKRTVTLNNMQFIQEINEE